MLIRRRSPSRPCATISRTRAIRFGACGGTPFRSGRASSAWASSPQLESSEPGFTQSSSDAHRTLKRMGNRERVPRSLVLIAVLLAVGAPGTASASTAIRYGVQDDAWIRYGPGTLAQRLDRLRSLGVELVRMNVDWSEVEPRPGVYDTVLGGLHSRGIEPVLTLLSTPRWANGGQSSNWAPTAGATFAAFAAAAAKHYPYVHRWLIWNEPNQRRWLRPTEPAVYVDKLLNPAYAAIHRVNPSALVGGGVTAPRASTGGVSPVAWIEGMAKAHAHLDAYAHNPYPLDPGETPTSGGCMHCTTLTMATLPRLLADVRAAFGAKTRIWLSEYGYQTDPPDTLLGVPDSEQARYLAEAALRAYLAPRVDMLVQYLVQDDSDLAGWQSGLLTATGARKPSYAAFQVPFAVEKRTPATVTLWGQIRPGTGARQYELEELKGAAWQRLGSVAPTGSRGFFVRTVKAPPKTLFRVVEITRGLASATSPALTS